eukprot:scaffold61712_cov69-Phaeocystis_antarctica.AAC.10
MARVLAGADLVPAVAQAAVVAPDAICGGKARAFCLLGQRRLGIFLVHKPLTFEPRNCGQTRFGMEALHDGQERAREPVSNVAPHHARDSGCHHLLVCNVAVALDGAAGLAQLLAEELLRDLAARLLLGPCDTPRCRRAQARGEVHVPGCDMSGLAMCRRCV